MCVLGPHDPTMFYRARAGNPSRRKPAQPLACAPKRGGSSMRYLKYGAIALVAVVVLALGIVVVADRMAQPAPADPAPLLAKAARYDVHIRRDTWGVPHILGKRDADVAFGIGFAHSQDDFATIQDVALASRGTLAAANGPGGATTD